MTFARSTLACLITVALLLLAGCDANRIAPDRGSAAGGPFGPPDKPAIMVPFEGDWTFNLEKTLEARKANGASPEDIEQIRKMHTLMSDFGGLHGDLAIAGTVLASLGKIPSEYRIFNLHNHGDIVCGKAWHHEDRYDPGDMSKCRIQMSLADRQLLLKIRWQSSSVNPNDPDLLNPKVINPAAASTCDSDKLSTGPNALWSPWDIFVFDKAKSS